MLKRPVLPIFPRVGLSACLYLILLLMGFASFAEAETADPARSLQTVPVTVVTGHEAGQVVGRWVYDSEGNLLRTTDDTGRTVRFRRDQSSGAVEAEDSSGQSMTLVPVHDAAGHLIATVGSTGWSAHYRYDAEGRWMTTEFSDGALETVDYHDQGFTVTLTPTDDDPVRFEYDTAGRLSKTVDGFGQETDFHYDAAGRLIGESEPNGEATRYTYRRGVRSVTTGTAAASAKARVAANGRAATTLPPVFVSARRCKSDYDVSPYDPCLPHNHMTRHAELLAMGYVVRGGAYILGTVVKLSNSRIATLLRAGQQADRNGLTKAGRALQKHGDRPGSVFPKASGNPASKNAQGQRVLEDILRSKSQSIGSNRFGGVDIFDKATGRGARFDAKDEFMGFLEP